jgi:hypothetical protein
MIIVDAHRLPNATLHEHCGNCGAEFFIATDETEQLVRSENTVEHLPPAHWYEHLWPKYRYGTAQVVKCFFKCPQCGNSMDEIPPQPKEWSYHIGSGVYSD